MGDVLRTSSVRVARDNWIYREQTSVVVRRPYSADSAEKMGRVPDFVNKRTRISRPAESPKLPRRGAVRRGFHILCLRPRLREGRPVVTRRLTASATGLAQRRCRLANCAAPLRRASNRSPYRWTMRALFQRPAWRIAGSSMPQAIMS